MTPAATLNIRMSVLDEMNDMSPPEFCLTQLPIPDNTWKNLQQAN